MATFTSSMHTSSDNVYPVRESGRTGRGIIISIEDPPVGGKRPGGKVDRERMTRLLRDVWRLQTDVLVDPTAQQVNACLRRLEDEFSERGEKDDFFVCVIMAHGSQGTFSCADGERIDLKTDVFPRFKSSRAAALAGKPKIFLINKCRGHRSAAAVGVDGGGGGGGGESKWEADDEADDGTTYVADDTDFLTAYSSTPGHVSWRNEEKGSWMMSLLCDIFEKAEHEGKPCCDLVKALNKVNLLISQQKLAREDGVKLTQCLQQIGQLRGDILLPTASMVCTSFLKFLVSSFSNFCFLIFEVTED
jgi:hypothetical protein